MSRRSKTLDMPPLRRSGTGPLHLLVDSTGLKLGGAGEWLVAQVVHSAGYNLLSFTRAFAVVKCQSALACLPLRTASHAWTSSFNTC